MENQKPEKTDPFHYPNEFPEDAEEGQFKTIYDLDKHLGLDPGDQVPIISDRAGCSIGVALLAIAFALGTCVGFIMAYWSLQ